MLTNFGNILMLAFGFGFVIFWHELGHFLAAKWAKVKVEQFAVGFGQALVCWRKGLGFTWGTSQEAFLSRVKSHIETRHATELQLKELVSPTEAQIAAAATELGISETEYRLNWIPLGGYVKMMGQDDLKPGQTVSDPRSYNNKTIGQRMVIVSAGVIMNIILAAIGFMYIFTGKGFEVPRPVIGLVVPGSPAQTAYKIVNNKQVPTSLEVGDTVLTLNGRETYDFEKIRLNTLLMIAGETVPMKVRRAGGIEETIFVTPAKSSPDAQFPQIGIGEFQKLQGLPKETKLPPADGSKALDEYTLINPGDVITSINGTPVDAGDSFAYEKLDNALQSAAGRDTRITVTDKDGKTRDEVLKAHFLEHFGDDPVNFAGMEMPVTVVEIAAKSTLIDKLKPGDVIRNIAEIGAGGGQLFYPTAEQTIREFKQAGDHGTDLRITVARGGEVQPPVDAKPTVKLDDGRVGFGLGLVPAEHDMHIAGLLNDTAAKAANVRPGSELKSINGKPVHNWFEVNNLLEELKPDQPLQITATFDNVETPYTLKPLTQEQINSIAGNRLQAFGTRRLVPDEFPRKAKNLIEAAGMGVEETRDAILQVYQTVRSMAHGSISPKEVSGPVGILSAGYKVAERGTTRLIWFLSIISANLAVMNFLPIPIVDGGLFTFLIIEKLKGSPISQRTQSIAQAVGLVLLLSVFVFATYQDVARLPMMFGK